MKKKSPAEQLAATKPKRRKSRDTKRRYDVLVCKLRERREAMGLTLYDVAEAVEMGPGHLSVIERGTVTQVDTAQRLAKFYGCTVDDLWPMD